MVDDSLIQKALELNKLSIAKLIRLFENQKKEALLLRSQVIAKLSKLKKNSQKAFIFGLTGTPGAGKSSLVSKLAHFLIEGASQKTLAIVAIDPASQASGGALLGDRIRSGFDPSENRLFFRSQSSQNKLGGISPDTYQVCRLLYYLFDIVVVETVGIGQNETEVKQLADTVALVMQPLGGDQIQFMKAGIMEVPDCFVINKCDQKQLAQKSYYSLKSSLDLLRPDQAQIPIFQTSAQTGLGIAEFADYLKKQAQKPSSFLEKEAYFFKEWLKKNYGEFGFNLFEKHLPTKEQQQFFLNENGFEKAQIYFEEQVFKI